MLAGLFPLALQRMLPARRLAAAARTLTVDLRDLQSRAALTGWPLTITVEPNGYSLQRKPAGQATYVPLPRDVRLALRADDHAAATAVLVMYPDGTSSGGWFELRAGQRLTTIEVNPFTGRTHVSP
jgi:hypothetical protein